MEQKFGIQNNKSEGNKLSLEKSQRFVSFLRNGDFTFLKVGKDRINNDEIGLEFGASGERGMDDWGNVLFTINVKSEEFSQLVKEPTPEKQFDRLSKVSHAVTKENITKAWGSCADGKSFTFNVKEGKVLVNSPEGGLVEMPLEGELKAGVDKALERFLKQSEGADYQIDRL